MGVLSAIRGAFGTKAAGSGAPTVLTIPPLGSMPSASGVLVSQATAMGVSTVYACVNRRAKDVARCKPRLFKPTADGGRTLVTDHPVVKLFKRPNRRQTWFEFMMQMMGAKLLRSNAFAVILRDHRGDPIELIPINPDCVVLLESVDGQVFYQINRLGLFQMSVLQGQPIAVPSEDVLHVMDMSFNLLAGVATLGLARDSIGLAMTQEQQAARFAGNSTCPSGVLQTDKKLTSESAARLKASWDGMVSGIQNVGRTAVLEDGLKWQQLQLKATDLEFQNARGFQIGDNARFFDVPLSMIPGGMMTSPSKITPAEEEQSYVNRTVMPDLDMWEQKIARAFDLDLDDIEVDFDETCLLRADITARYNSYRVGVLTSILTPNEARASERLAPMEGGDKLLAPINLAALGSDATGTAPDGAGRPEAGTLPTTEPGATEPLAGDTGE